MHLDASEDCSHRGVTGKTTDMALPIEDYAIIADTQTSALVGRNGSIDWLCVPRFDSGAIFAALLGDEENGHWTIRPAGEVLAVRRRYRHETLVLETEFETADGVVRLIDFMPPRGEAPALVRIVEGVRGTVPMVMELRLRFDYGQVVPWVYREQGALVAVAGPDAAWLRTPVETRGENMATLADFSVRTGERTPFVLTWNPSHLAPPAPIDPVEELGLTEGYWRGWVSACTYEGEWRDAVVRSLLTLKALTYAPTGGIVAAATTSLPEKLAAYATGTIASAGCGTPRSPCRPCCSPVFRARRSPGASGCCGRSPAIPPSCRSCTAWPVSAAWTSIWRPG
jgi:GH15 family glucan-1,4-alpha-glucosidase